MTVPRKRFVCNGVLGQSKVWYRLGLKSNSEGDGTVSSYLIKTTEIQRIAIYYETVSVKWFLCNNHIFNFIIMYCSSVYTKIITQYYANKYLPSIIVKFSAEVYLLRIIFFIGWHLFVIIIFIFDVFLSG